MKTINVIEAIKLAKEGYSLDSYTIELHNVKINYLDANLLWLAGFSLPDKFVYYDSYEEKETCFTSVPKNGYRSYREDSLAYLRNGFNRTLTNLDKRYLISQITGIKIEINQNYIIDILNGKTTYLKS